ncbi:trigger factor [Sulfurirhabdus autotrophica]|uniref:Trigger factor n=1 Tax=Sulfurirhabdus autotrophica TaxID=1706046 RepID=A0A4R3Y546_9PROT|nr:trigger factor [Sulfurirhabdus autotrophica]TCV87365.1 trigger factor [Sulfurirhabdus autotrophica]
MQSENLSPLEKRLDVTLPNEQITTEVANRLKQLARNVKVHGFRPGKVPMKIVEQQHGGQVRQEVLGEALQKGFSEAVRAQQFRVAGYPRFEAKPTPEGENNWEFTATFEVYPEVVLGDISGKTIERPTVQVGEADIDKTIEILRKQRVQYENVDRAVVTGDQVNIDYQGKMDGTVFPGGQAHGQVIVLGESRLLKDFENQLIGMVKGQEKVFELTFPEDYHGKDVAGKTVTFEVKLNAVAEPTMPAVDAEFAKTLGVEDGDLEKMRGEIKANLEREVKSRVKNLAKEKVMEALLDTSKLDLPKALVGMEVERLMQQAQNDMVARGMKVSDIPLPPEIFEEQAKRRVGLGLILAELVKANSLQAKPDQVRAILTDYAQSYEQPEEMVKWYYQNPERLAEVESLALEDNVVAWVLERAKVEDKSLTFDELMGNAK